MGVKAYPSWSQVFPATSMAALFGLYPSKGDVTISTTTNLPVTLDGPIQVARYGALTVNSVLTTNQRNRGLCVLCDSLVMNNGGVIGMSARGAWGGPSWANQTILLPATGISLTGKTPYPDFSAWLKSTGYAIFDPTLFACPPPGMPDVQADYGSWPAKGGSPIVSGPGCGAQTPISNGTGVAGYAGYSGGTGGGGRGGCDAYSSIGLKGYVWGGGVGGGGFLSGCHVSNCPWQYGGRGGEGVGGGGGGAGNPGGSGANAGATGTGGILIIICRGACTLASGHSLVSYGSAGGSSNGTAYAGGGAGSGGGSVSLYAGSFSGSANIGVSGGGGGAGTYYGGAGGSGSYNVATLATMGWS